MPTLVLEPFDTHSTSKLWNSASGLCWDAVMPTCVWLYAIQILPKTLACRLLFPRYSSWLSNTSRFSSDVGALGVDNLWAAIAHNQYNPCSWPFIECTPTCQPTWEEGWRNNKIAGIDWRNLQLFVDASGLNFTMFEDYSSLWYLNLNYNMIGGNISNLSLLPWQLSGLRHLGLSHCRLGPGFYYDASLADYDDYGDVIPNPLWMSEWGTHATWEQAHTYNCSIADSDLSTRTIIRPLKSDPFSYIPNVTSTSYSFESLAADGVPGSKSSCNCDEGDFASGTDVLYGTIPTKWGNGGAPWRNSLSSVNLMNQNLRGTIPSGWYKRELFPNLAFIKLLGNPLPPGDGSSVTNLCVDRATSKCENAGAQFDAVVMPVNSTNTDNITLQH